MVEQEQSQNGGQHANTDNGLPFGQLCTQLAANGFVLGTDQQLRLQTLLQTLGKECQNPKELRDILCPLFAKSQAQQQEFARIYNTWWLQTTVSRAVLEKMPDNSGGSSVGQGAGGKDDPEWWAKEWLYWLAAVALITLTVWATSRWVAGGPTQTPKLEEVVEKFPPRKLQQKGRVASVTREVIRPPLVDPAWVIWWRAHRQEVHLGSSLCLAIWAAYELRRWRNRRLILQRARLRQATPPYEIPLQLPQWRSAYSSNRFLRGAVRLLRFREAGSGVRLDVDATLQATLSRGGYPKLRYKPSRREPTYLLLIDRQSQRDHQAALFGLLASALKSWNLPVAVYYFRGDPRYCENASTGSPIALAALETQHWSARLLLATDGEQLRHPATGELLPWVEKVLRVWEHRAILTPCPNPTNWGDRERTLAKFFIVEPATAEGLGHLAKRWGTASAMKAQPIPTRWQEADPWRDPTQQLDELRTHLGEPAFRWVCACAIYPELHWDLTMHLAGLSQFEQGLDQQLRETPNLMQLVQIKWFRRGWIPEAWRVELASKLTPKQERAVREEIFRILDKTDVEENTAAGHKRRLTMEFTRHWLDAEEGARWRKLRRWLRRPDQGSLARDAVVLRSIDSLRHRSRLDFLLPEGLSRRLHQHGISLFGLRTAVRVGALLLAGVACVAGVVFVEEWADRLQSPGKYDPAKTVVRHKLTISTKLGELNEAYLTIPAGSFQMGCSPGDSECFRGEEPAHLVRLTKDFHLAETEVTIGNFEKFAADTALRISDEDRRQFAESDKNLPMTYVNWSQAKAYCEWSGGRLPTEAEWEYAGRGGSTGARYGELNEIAWYGENSGGRAHPVRQKRPNAYGLYDMLGNVWEWTSDWYQTYGAADVDNPFGSNRGDSHVVRGGSWNYGSQFSRVSGRSLNNPGLTLDDFGFRCAREGF